uniref:NCK-associated protein 5-like n=1 Tax=Scophthalmus maximus TaxID=52904 RepID=A0A8D3CMZ9_SCOMX
MKKRRFPAENSALILANESQREAYERCLDEVANHVVQALLNQKDLREECIKLKMLVFDLERQNRALCELFQQKLPNHPAAHYQVSELPPSHFSPQGNGYRTQHASPGPRGPAASMEALSPFFKKKAHILEVLRKMEETDPLKFHPSTASLSFCDYSQVLMSTEAVLATADPLPLHAREGTPAAVYAARGAPTFLRSHATTSVALRKPTPPPRAMQFLQLLRANVTVSLFPRLNNVPRLKPTSHQQAPPPTRRSQRQPIRAWSSVKEISHCDLETSDGVHNGLALPSVDNSASIDPSSIPERDSTDPEACSVRASASVSPSSSCLSDVKAAAINSPSKLLKFLKIPSIGEKSQAPTPPVRLSPQLTRSSRIPCRTNNYEVYHSPVPTRRATTTERCRQPPPPPSRSESYPMSAPSSASSSSPKVSQRVPHYENVCDMSTNSRAEEPTQGLEKRTTLPSQAKANGGERKLVKSLPESALNPPPQRKHSEVAQPPPPPPPARRGDSSSIPKRPASGAARSQADSSHHAFKDRLAALGKLRSSEDLQVGLRPVDAASDATCGEERSKTFERPMELLKEEQRHSKYTDSLDGKPKGGSGGLKYPGSSQLYDQAIKSQSSAPAVAKQELCVIKTEGPKSRIGLPSPNADAPQVLRNNIKCPGSLNLAYNLKPGPHGSSSPNKIPPKSPSKPCQGPLPPPPPRPPTSEGEKPLQPAPSPQSAIEQKVMKGIEENMLKLQEQDRGGPATEVKQKASNGIASWFGLKKSKLPALSRKADGTKAKDEKKEWKINIPSVGRDSVKMATRCKEGVEGLNISTLMEKAEGLRRALEEERAYVERSGRGHSCEVVMDPAQGQLAVMYRGARSDNFMQQLLNRVDGKEAISVPQRRLSFDCKTSKPVFAQQSDVIGHITCRDDMEKVRSGASTYTLDSGIGTFPLPDCSSGAAGRSLSKTRAGAEHHSSGSPGRAGRRARTLDRELTPQEECYTPHKQLIPTIQYGAMLEGRGSAGVIREGANKHTRWPSYT